MTSSPHDAIFKATFGQADLARSELELVLPPEVRAHLDLATLEIRPGSFVDPELQQAHTDLLYAVRTRTGEEGFVYVLFEHQSSHDGTMTFRILKYVVRIWEHFLKHHPGAKLPIVIPVLLHQGEPAWKTAPELASMLDGSPELIEATRPFAPHFRFVLDDLAALSPAAVATRSLAPLPRLVQLAMWASRSFPRLRDAVPFMRAVVATLARDDRARALLEHVYRYVLSTVQDVDVREIRTMLLEVAGPEGEEDVMNAAEQLIAEGEQRGEQKTLRGAIARVLAARGLPLSEVGRARIASCADVATLTRWLDRAATATSEAEVFRASDAP
jgi:predicted transposase/invertase (TIGR01784 family)